MGWKIIEDKAIETFARNLRTIRANRGLSVEELSKRSNVSKSTIHAYERGQGNPRVRTIGALAYALDIDANFFTMKEFPMATDRLVDEVRKEAEAEEEIV